jgi:hypothetical protein
MRNANLETLVLGGKDMNYYLQHHGILGQKWGVRRYQNPDGSLTEEGRKRLDLDKYGQRFGDDYSIKKGTEATRVMRISDAGTSREEEFNKLFDRESKKDTKYVSIEQNRNLGPNGTKYYMSWFGDGGYDADYVAIDRYKIKNDVRVAGGKTILNEILKEYGDTYINSVDNKGKELSNSILNRLTMEYTTNREMHDRINNRLKKSGYKAIEDINDRISDWPVIMLDSKNDMVNTGRYLWDDYIEKYIKTV